jgi:hypothetical protein
MVSVPECPDPEGGDKFPARDMVQINATMNTGGPACTLLTVQQLTLERHNTNDMLVPLLLVVNRQHSSLLPALVAALAVSQGVGRGASGQPTGDAGGELAGMVEQFLRRCPRSGHEPWLRDLVKGDEVGNPVNSGWLVEADWWILARLSSVLPPTGAQLTLDFHGSTDDARDHSAIMRRALFRTSSVPRLSQLELLRRLRSHPLRDGSLQIQRCEPAWVEAGEAAAARG